MGLWNGSLVVLDITNYNIIFQSKLFDHGIRFIRMLKNKDIAIATDKGLFFAKNENMTISLINPSYLQNKHICFYNEIETNDGYIVFWNLTDKKLCLLDIVNGKYLDLHN